MLECQECWEKQASPCPGPTLAWWNGLCSEGRSPSSSPPGGRALKAPVEGRHSQPQSRAPESFPGATGRQVLWTWVHTALPIPKLGPLSPTSQKPFVCH